MTPDSDSRGAPATGPVRHFVITRFNLRTADPSSRRMISREYLEPRLALFERFCLPTLRAQSCQDFTWLVLFASDTPDDLKARVQAYTAWPNLVPVWLEPGTEHVGPIVVQPYLDAGPSTLITSRVDNDDGLARTYIEDVRRFEGAGRRTVVQFPVGYVWHRDRAYLSRQEHNAFTSLVEPLPRGRDSEFTTIYKGSHTDIHQLGDVVDAHDRPGWLQVVHDSNVANYVRGTRVRMAELPRHFDVTLPAGAERENGLEIALDRARRATLAPMERLGRAVRSRLDRSGAG